MRPGLPSQPGSHPETSFLSTVIWLLCHYPDTEECHERVLTAARLQRSLGVPIWLFGSSSARYPIPVEQMIKEQVLRAGVSMEKVFCSKDLGVLPPSLDTVQEALNVIREAEQRGVQTLVGVSNRLQLAQVYGLLRRYPVRLMLVPTPLRERRWWYVVARVILVPLAFLGVGRQFPILILTRWARGRLSWYPF